MDRRLSELLDELHTHGVTHDAAMTDRSDRLRNLEPDTAAVLAVLVIASRARDVLELGTSNGYSTLWLADAVRKGGGHLTSVELRAERSQQAADTLARAGLSDTVELRVADAGDVLRESPDSAWDLILLDADRAAYAGYWPDLLRVLVPAGVIAVDNVLSHSGEVEAFRSLVSAEETVSEALVPTGAGALLVVKHP